VPRSVRAKARASGAYSRLENALRQTPDDAELARELGMSERDLTRALSQIIGNVLGVTESRACQIHTKAILQLARLGDPERGPTE
jgi:DNA-directed RNA polymerase specialized sigma subunit